MTVAHILKEKGGEVVSIGAGRTIAEALRLLAEHRIGAVPVLGLEQRLVGMLSERDIVRGLVDAGGGLLEKPVEQLMTKDVVTVGPTDSVVRLMSIMTEGRFRHLPVIHKDKMIGLVSIGDVVKHRIAEAEHEAEALKNYIRTG